jgi:GT2 family glycosyltransferase
MKISVVIPVHNGEAFLQRCVKSALDQKLENYELEVIIQNNMSTDNTKKIAVAFGDPRVVFFETEELLDAGSNWTNACRKATGDYIKLLPVDDTLLPGALWEQAKALDESIDRSFVSSWRYLSTATGRRLPAIFGALIKGGEYTESDILQLALIEPRNFFGEPGCVLFRAEVLKSCLPWRMSTGYAMDLDLYLRSLRHGKAMVLERQNSTFQISHNSLSNKATRKQSSSTSEVLAEFIEKQGGMSIHSRRGWLEKIKLRGYLRLFLYFFMFGFSAIPSKG